MLSGPTVLAVFSVDKERQTSSLETKSPCGTKLGGLTCVKGEKCSVILTKKLLILFANAGCFYFIKKLMIPLLLDILPSKILYLPPPLTRIGGIHVGYFAMIVMLFSFADFVL